MRNGRGITISDSPMKVIVNVIRFSRLCPRMCHDDRRVRFERLTSWRVCCQASRRRCMSHREGTTTC
jgi:hypothetical protein